MREELISNFISGVNFSGEWSQKDIKEGLKKILGEEPAIKFNYTKDARINEVNSEAYEVNILESIDIMFSPQLDNVVKKKTFLINKEV